MLSAPLFSGKFARTRKPTFGAPSVGRRSLELRKVYRLTEGMRFFAGVFETGVCHFNPSFLASVSRAWLRNPFETSGSRKLVWVARLISSGFLALSDYHLSRQQPS